LFWDRKVELVPLHVLAHLHLGWLDEEKGAWTQAQKHYARAVQLDADNLPATLRLGMMHFRQGDTGQAIHQFQRALELDPANLDTHYYLYAIYRRSNMEAEALEQLRIIKAGENSQQLVELFSRHGEDHFRVSRYAEASDDYQLALQFDPSNVSLYVALGDLYHLQQQSHTALETWCRGLWAGYSEALAERVLVLVDEEVLLQPATQLVRECVARHLQDGRYHLLLSRLLHRAGAEEESIALLERAVRLTPSLLQAQKDLGDVYARVGQDSKARLAYRAGLGAARAQEVAYCCRACGYVTRQDQPRCFRCDRWGTLAEMTWAEAQARVPAGANVLERAGTVRRKLYAAWNKIAGQLPPGG
jgi:tetratricopeptide (TPR) repeat protein